jgi:hypothetical protein
VEKEQVDLKIAAANLHGIMTTDKAEITTEFDEEILQLCDEAIVEIGFGMVFGKIEKLDQITVLKDRCGFGCRLSLI